jgi:hypothetical protein
LITPRIGAANITSAPKTKKHSEHKNPIRNLFISAAHFHDGIGNFERYVAIEIDSCPFDILPVRRKEEYAVVIAAITAIDIGEPFVTGCTANFIILK